MSLAKFLYVCSRTGTFNEATAALLAGIGRRLEPDNIRRPQHHAVHCDPYTAWLVAGDSDAVQKAGLSLFSGHFIDPDTDWMTPGAPAPDGSFVIFRQDGGICEILTDAGATTTVWIYHDADLFVASSSQRAIVMFKGLFAFNSLVLPWLLAGGSLGPEMGWDPSLFRLGPAARLTLSRHDWSLHRTEPEITFAPQRPREAEQRLRDAIAKSVDSLRRLDFESWILLLSGGYDSRGILNFLTRDGPVPQLRTVTWGLEAAQHEPGNDARIARELAERAGTRHAYHLTNLSTEPMGIILARFLRAGEGRIDHINGYMDGMEIWRILHDDNTAAVIRGDEGFGWAPVHGERSVRASVGLALLSDHMTADEIASFGFCNQELPPSYARRSVETLEQWRDRLYHQFRLPCVLAALSDIKRPYVEIINPLITNKVFAVVRELPDPLRTNKTLFRRIVRAFDPDLEIATRGANAETAQLLREPAMRAEIVAALNSPTADELFSARFLDMLRQQLEASQHPGKTAGNGRQPTQGRRRRLRSFLRAAIAPLVPAAILSRVLRVVQDGDTAKPRPLPGDLLAFRASIAVWMCEILRQDAGFAQSAGLHPAVPPRT